MPYVASDSDDSDITHLQKHKHTQHIVISMLPDINYTLSAAWLVSFHHFFWQSCLQVYCIAGGESEKQKIESIKASKQPSSIQLFASQLKQIAASQRHLNQGQKWSKAQLKEKKVYSIRNAILIDVNLTFCAKANLWFKNNDGCSQPFQNVYNETHCILISQIIIFFYIIWWITYINTGKISA